MRPFRAFSFALAACLLLLLLPISIYAESVTLNNGDRITGAMGDSDGKTLTLKTPYAGDVKIQWSAIKEMTAAKPLYITTKDKKTISGSVAPNGANLTVHSTAGATVDVPFAKIVSVRSSEGEESYQKSLHPAWDQDWKGNATIGLGLARGNSDTTNLNTGFHLDRKTPSDHLGMYESSVYATSSPTAIHPAAGVTANAILGGIRYDHNITQRLFGFGAGDFTHDELQGLDIREIYTGGLGWHAIEKPATTFNVLGGVNYTRESYSGATTGSASTVGRNLPGLTFGEEFMHKVGGTITLNEAAYFYPDLSDLSQYRFSLDSSAVTQIRKWLGWQVSLSDRYVTNPPILGTESNDVILSTGLNVAFGK